MTDVLLAQGSTILHTLIGLAMVLVSIILVGLILLQQGKGGGLVGLGGMGGASVMGTRADRQVMYGTIGFAAFWFLLCIIGILILSNSSASAPRRLLPGGAMPVLGPETSTDPDTPGIPPASGSTEPAPGVAPPPADTAPADATPADATPAGAATGDASTPAAPATP